MLPPASLPHFREEKTQINAKKWWCLYQKLYTWLLLNRRETNNEKILAEYIATPTQTGTVAKAEGKNIHEVGHNNPSEWVHTWDGLTVPRGQVPVHGQGDHWMCTGSFLQAKALCVWPPPPAQGMCMWVPRPPSSASFKLGNLVLCPLVMINSNLRGLPLVCVHFYIVVKPWSCCDRAPQTGQLTEHLLCPSSGSWESGIKVWAQACASEDPRGGCVPGLSPASRSFLTVAAQL